MDQNTQAFLTFFVNVVVSGVAGTVAASRFIGEYKNKVDNLETTLGKDEHGGLRKTVGDVRDRIIACEAVVNERGPLTKKKSPVSLTDRGISFLQHSGGEKFVDDNFNELLESVNKLNPSTAYDVQEDAKKVVEALKDDARLDPLKEFLFKDGSTLEELFTVMSIHLRDKILKHKNLNVSDIDLHENSD